MSGEQKRPAEGITIPAQEQFRFWTEMPTRNRDTDQFGHVNHAAMATLYEESRIALIYNPGTAAETAGIDLVVAKLTMSFHRELRAPGRVRIGAAVSRIGTSSLSIQQAVFDEMGTCFASAEATCVLIGSESRRPVRVSDALRLYLMPAE